MFLFYLVIGALQMFFDDDDDDNLEVVYIQVYTNKCWLHSVNVRLTAGGQPV